MKDNREFVFTDDDFFHIRDLLGSHAGIVLSEIKKDLVYGRLSKRLRKLGINRFDDYLTKVEADEGELVEFINALTTNLTSFFRENHHFEFMTNELLPALIKEKAANRKLRIWSAGCSTGEEPYSIAMTVRDVFKDLAGWDIKIIATDLDTNVVNAASSGVYPIERVKGLPAKRLKRWFRKGVGQNDGYVRVVDDLRTMIEFRPLNLLGGWPMKDSFDFMFCRNVVIYFDKDTQRKLFDRYANVIKEQGHLFIGHSESLHSVSDRFSLVGNTIYQKSK